MHTLMIDDQEKLYMAADILRAGGLVAVPTETVYGLCANALDEHAVSNIYKAKGRPSDNPLIIHIADLEKLQPLVAHIPDSASLLIEHFWPGPLTLIFESTSLVPLSVRGGLSTVAIRFPSHPTMQDLIRMTGLPLAAPSANTSGKPSPTNAKRVFEDLNGKIDAIVDGGLSTVGVESTIVDLTSGTPTILRPGGITQDMLLEVLDTIIMDPALLSVDATTKPKAPGMKYTHYAPNAEVMIYKGDDEKVVEAINAALLQDKAHNIYSGVLCDDETKSLFHSDFIISLGSRHTPCEIAMHLFEALRTFDDLKVQKVYALSFSTEGVGSAIMNRLEKSAGHHIIYV
ncbi:MAG: L-threonylcarbamoyladenylate synthase [Niameybacter sp.]